MRGRNIRVDGTGLERISVPLGVPGSKVVPSFSVGGRRTKVVRVALPGIPVSTPVPVGCPDSGVPCADFPITEVFLQDGKNSLQLTQFRSADTFVGFVSRSGKRAFFMASVDPLGTNPHGDCQIFSVNSHGGGLRQLTRFNRPIDSPIPGCFGTFGHCSVGEGYYRVIFQDPVTKAVVFTSTCDPRGAYKGNQIFAIWPDGNGLRQLTEAAGVAAYPDGSFRVELVGPFAYSAAVH